LLDKMEPNMGLLCVVMNGQFFHQFSCPPKKRVYKKTPFYERPFLGQFEYGHFFVCSLAFVVVVVVVVVFVFVVVVVVVFVVVVVVVVGL
jgi:hypothetical protein